MSSATTIGLQDKRMETGWLRGFVCSHGTINDNYTVWWQTYALRPLTKKVTAVKEVNTKSGFGSGEVLHIPYSIDFHLIIYLLIEGGYRPRSSARWIKQKRIGDYCGQSQHYLYQYEGLQIPGWGSQWMGKETVSCSCLHFPWLDALCQFTRTLLRPM